MEIKKKKRGRRSNKVYVFSGTMRAAENIYQPLAASKKKKTAMDYTEKIFWTILFGIGGLILPIMIDKTNSDLKRRLEASNPELVKNQSWFFSDTKNKILKWIMLILLIGWIIMIWTTDIKIGE